MLFKKTKTIPWNKFFKIEREEMVTLKVIPDRTVDNKQNYKLARALHDLYASPLSRFSFDKWFISYRPQGKIWYDIVLTNEAINFYFTVPKRWETYARQKLSGCWPKASIEGATQEELYIPEDCKIAEMVYKRHNIFSLHCHRNEDTQPLRAIMQTTKDMLEGDKVRLSICMDPINRLNWNDQAEIAHKEFVKGKTPQRTGFNKRKLLLGVANIIEGIFDGLCNTALNILGHDEKENKRHAPDIEKREILLEGRLQSETNSKRTEPTFKTYIRIASTSKDGDRKELNLKAVANSFVEVAGDNELERVDVPKRAKVRILYELNNHKLSTLTKLTPDSNVMSASELGKLSQLPGAGLQEEFSEQVETIKHRQSELPALITSKGMKLGEQQYKNNKLEVFMPVKDHDELCLPDIIIGGKGTGKTKGYGANKVVEAVLNGFGGMAIDPAKREMAAEIKAVLPPEMIRHIDLSKMVICLDWVEVKHSPRAKSRLANTIVGFFNSNADDTGAQTSRYLKAAVMAMQTNKLSEILRIFEDEVYRKKVTKMMSEGFNKNTLTKFGQLSEARQLQIMEPIYNRLSVITSDEYLEECMDAENSLDMVELLSEKKAVIIDIPTDSFDPLAIDLLVNLLSTKIDLAMRLRPDEKQHPFFIVFDEPHQYLKSATLWKSQVAEARKWRIGFTWLFHAWDQLPRDLAEIIKSALPHYHIYSSSPKTYKELALEIAPFSIEEAYKTPRHHAINVLRAGGDTITPFMAKMLPPPTMRKDLNTGTG